MKLSGIITTSSPYYDSETNSFYIDHGLSNLYAMPFSIALYSDGSYQEIVASKVEFEDSSVRVYLGSLVFGENDMISYMFNASEVSDSESIIGE